LGGTLQVARCRTSKLRPPSAELKAKVPLACREPGVSTLTHVSRTKRRSADALHALSCAPGYDIRCLLWAVAAQAAKHAKAFFFAVFKLAFLGPNWRTGALGCSKKSMGHSIRKFAAGGLDRNWLAHAGLNGVSPLKVIFQGRLASWHSQACQNSRCPSAPTAGAAEMIKAKPISIHTLDHVLRVMCSDSKPKSRSWGRKSQYERSVVSSTCAALLSLLLSACSDGGDSSLATVLDQLQAREPVHVSALSSDTSSAAQPTKALPALALADYRRDLATDNGTPALAGHLGGDHSLQELNWSNNTGHSGTVDPTPVGDNPSWSTAALPLKAGVNTLTFPAMDSTGRVAASFLKSVSSSAEKRAAARAEILVDFDRNEYLTARLDGQSETLNGVADASANKVFSTHPGKMQIQYEGGDLKGRSATISPSPTDPGNRVLHFRLSQAGILNASGLPEKGRIQLNAYDVEQVRAREVRFTTRMYLYRDFDLLRSMRQKFTWLTLSEWWNNPSWGNESYPFRIKLNLTKPDSNAGTALRFHLSAETFDPGSRRWNNALWQATNTEVEIPTGEWVNLEYYFREGNSREGRFGINMIHESGARVVLFDVHNWTHHPDDPAPDGITHINPLKLYTSKQLIDHVRGQGGELQVDWDELAFRICRERTHINTSPCRPLF